MGALSPKDLWEGVQFQIREIVYSLFQWEDGPFHFEESMLPEKERITVDLDIVDLILAGIRRVESAGRIQGRYPRAGHGAGAGGGRVRPRRWSPTSSTCWAWWTASAARWR